MLKRVLVITMLLLFTLPPMAYAGPITNSSEKEGLTLNIDQAVEMALKNSTSIKTAQYNVERANEVQEAADEKVDYIPTSPSTSSTADAYYTSAVSASISARMAVKTKTVAEDKVKLETVKDYNSLLTAIADQEYAKKNVETTLLQLNNNRISFDYGLISSSALLGYETSYQVAKASLIQADLNLEKAYMTFNSLLGLPVNQRPILTEKLTYSPLGVANADTEISRILDECPTVWSAEQSAKLAHLQATLWSPGGGTPYEAQLIDEQKAVLAASDTKSQMRDLIKTLYNAILQSESAYISANEQVKSAAEALRIKKVMNDIGMATKYDVQSAELTLANAQKTLDSTVYQHEYLEMAFKKPWAY